MRLVSVLAFVSLAACHDGTQGDAVRQAYDNHADAVDNAAAAQPTDTGRRIYKARADALREEGRDREKGLEGGTPSPGQAGVANGQ